MLTRTEDHYRDLGSTKCLGAPVGLVAGSTVSLHTVFIGNFRIYGGTWVRNDVNEGGDYLSPGIPYKEILNDWNQD